jgi:hypothetical protein
MKPWIKMILCFLAIWGFVKFSPLLLNKIESYQLVIKNSEQMGIDNATLFYSEEPLTSDAEQYLKQQLEAAME